MSVPVIVLIDGVAVGPFADWHEANRYRESDHEAAAMRIVELHRPARGWKQQRGGVRIVTPSGSVECPHCHWGFAPSVIEQHIREKH